MTIADLLAEVDRLGVRLEVEGDRLRFFPVSLVTGDLLEQMKARKQEIISALNPLSEQRESEPGSASADGMPACPSCGSSRWEEGLRYRWCTDCEAKLGDRITPLADIDESSPEDSGADASVDMESADEPIVDIMAWFDSLPDADDGFFEDRCDHTDNSRTGSWWFRDGRTSCRHCGRFFFRFASSEPKRWSSSTSTEPVETKPGRPDPSTTCLRCGSTRYRDVILKHHPHSGRSTRRDCRQCGRFMCFPVWYESVAEHESPSRGGCDVAVTTDEHSDSKCATCNAPLVVAADVRVCTKCDRYDLVRS